MEEQNIINFILSNKEIPGSVTQKAKDGYLIKPLIKGLQLENGESAREFFVPNRYAGDLNQDDFISFIWEEPGKIRKNKDTGKILPLIAKDTRVISEEDIQILVNEILHLVSSNEKEYLLAQQRHHIEILEERKRELDQQYVLQENELIQKRQNLDLDLQKLETKFNDIAQTELELSQKKDEIDNERKSIQVEQKESIKLRQEISRYTALLPLVRDSNSDPIISVISGSIPKTTDLEPEDLGDNWHKILTSRNLILPESIAISYLVSTISALYSGSIILLNGTVGVGKSSIIEKSAEALGGKAKIIPVRPSWLDPSDLLGFFDPLAETFRPSSFTSAIKEANDEGKN